MNAIVYTSNTGYTAQYARLLSKQTGLPAHPLGCDRFCTKRCHHPGQHHGDHTVYHSLYCRRTSDLTDVSKFFFGKRFKKADSFEYIFFFFRAEYSDHHHKHNDKLCADRRNCCSRHFNPRKRPYS